MSRWWAVRMTWLVLGALTGVIGILPDTSGALAGALVLIYIAAWAVMLGRWGVGALSDWWKSVWKKPEANKTILSSEVFPGVSLQFEAAKAAGARPPRPPKSGWLLSHFRAAGFQFKTQLKFEEEKADPRKAALVWDSVFFLGAVVGSAALMSLFM